MMTTDEVIDMIENMSADYISNCSCSCEFSVSEYLSDKTNIIEKMEYLDVIRELHKCNMECKIKNNNNGFTVKFRILMGICEKIVELNEPKTPPIFKYCDLVVDKSQNVFYVMNFIDDDYYYDDLNGKGFCMEQKEFERTFKKIGEITKDVKPFTFE